MDWKRTDVPRSALKDDLLASLGSQLTICAIRAKDAAWRLQQVIETGSDPGPSDEYGDHPKSLDQLAEKLLVDAAFLEDIVELLEDKGPSDPLWASGYGQDVLGAGTREGVGAGRVVSSAGAVPSVYVL